MRNFPFVIGIVFLVATSACVSQKVGEVASQPNQAPVSLTPDLFIGHTLTLDSNKRVECYHFGTNGVVLPAFSFTLRHGGVFHRSKQAIVCPVYDWKILDGHTLLMISAPEGEPVERIPYEFSLFSDALAVTTDGKRFKRTRDY
jgi:hypothetical protein